jgi:hypothetical protein
MDTQGHIIFSYLSEQAQIVCRLKPKHVVTETLFLTSDYREHAACLSYSPLEQETNCDSCPRHACDFILFSVSFIPLLLICIFWSLCIALC